MTNRLALASSIALLGAAVVATDWLSGNVLAQEDYTVPRTWDGSPDLQGVWRNATVTPLERPTALGDKRAYTREEALELERAAQQEVEEDNLPMDPNRPPPPAEELPPVGNYDLFWTDRGMFMPTVNGEFRTSIIIDPPNAASHLTSRNFWRLAQKHVPMARTPLMARKVVGSASVACCPSVHIPARPCCR